MSIMKSFNEYFMKKEYALLEQLGDKLAEIEPLIDWELFRPIIRRCMIIIQSWAVDLIMMK